MKRDSPGVGERLVGSSSIVGGGGEGLNPPTRNGPLIAQAHLLKALHHWLEGGPPLRTKMCPLTTTASRLYGTFLTGVPRTTR